MDLTGAGSHKERKLSPELADDLLASEPLTIVFRHVSERGAFDGTADAWTWSINSAGQGELTTHLSANLAKLTPATATRQAFRLSASQMAALRKTLREQRFAHLKDEYGPWVLHGGWSTLTVISGGHINKTVRFRFVWGWANPEEKDRLAGRAPAARVWLKVCEVVDPEGRICGPTKEFAEALRALDRR
jgi:hypothetical protein